MWEECSSNGAPANDEGVGGCEADGLLRCETAAWLGGGRDHWLVVCGRNGLLGCGTNGLLGCGRSGLLVCGRSGSEDGGGMAWHRSLTCGRWGKGDLIGGERKVESGERKTLEGI